MNLTLILAATIFTASVYVVYTSGESTEPALPSGKPQLFG
jgi:hypothetical protein